MQSGHPVSGFTLREAFAAIVKTATRDMANFNELNTDGEKKN